MDPSRRRLLAAAGASIPAVIAAGCLSDADPGDGTNGDDDSGDEDDGSGDANDGNGGDEDGSGDEDDGNGGDQNGDEGDLPRIDEPPYEITEPDCGPDGERDPLWLCANMDAEPSLAFESEETSSPVLRDEGLELGAEGGSAQFYATLLTGADDLDRVERNGGAVGDLLEGTDFDAEAVLVVQTGWGSGSVTPHVKRLEGTDDGIHAFGCYRRPCAGTDDYTVRTAVVRFERPGTLDSGVVSLTVDPETRVNVGLDEGVVTVEADSTS